MKKSELQSKEKKAIYIEMYGDLSYTISRILFAIALREKTGYDIIGFANENDSYAKRIAEMYDIKVYSMDKSLFFTVKCGLKTARIINTKMSADELFDYKIDGVNVGGYLYDTIVRYTKGVNTIDHLDWRMFPETAKFIRAFYFYSMHFNQIKPFVFLGHETSHATGMIITMVQEYGGYAFQVTAHGRVDYLNTTSKLCYLHEPYRGMFNKYENSLLNKNIDFDSEVDALFERKLAGLSGIDSGYAFKDKKIIDRQEFSALFSNFDITKKNVIIMSHCFSDTPHMESEKQLFKDYYTWYVETLKIASKVENVNWIVKAHPSRAIYNESDEAYKLYQKYNTNNNMYWFDDAYSTASLFDIADVVVTAMGTCGCEFPCKGIPVVCAGHPWYSNGEITIEPQTVEEYKSVLFHVSEIDRLTDEKIQLAKRKYYVNEHFMDPVDYFDEFVIKNTELSSDIANTNIYNYLCDEGDRYKNTWCYLEGLKWSEKLSGSICHNGCQ